MVGIASFGGNAYSDPAVAQGVGSYRSSLLLCLQRILDYLDLFPAETALPLRKWSSRSLRSSRSCGRHVCANDWSDSRPAWRQTEYLHRASRDSAFLHYSLHRGTTSRRIGCRSNPTGYWRPSWPYLQSDPDL